METISHVLMAYVAPKKLNPRKTRQIVFPPPLLINNEPSPSACEYALSVLYEHKGLENGFFFVFMGMKNQS